MAYTVGEFAASLEGVVSSLNDIAAQLSTCEPGAEIDTTPGRTAICQVPVIVGGICVAPERDGFTIVDLVETIEGLKDWVDDVRARLANYDSATSLEDGLRPPIESA